MNTSRLVTPCTHRATLYTPPIIDSQTWPLDGDVTKLTIWWLNLVFFENFSQLVAAVMLVLVVYGLYKAYWAPILYVKDLEDVGFEHIQSKGSSRSSEIRRVQASRRFGRNPPPPYPDGWFAVAESRDLPNGGVLSVQALGQNLCVYRGEDGAAHVIDAYCPHLGANLAVGGTVSGDCVRCPFHKWSFNGDGACVAVPGLETPPKGVGVKSWPVAEAEGAVWAWHSADGLPPRWDMQEPPEWQQYVYQGRNEFIVSTHIQDIPENGADVAHLNAVHSPSLLTTLADKYPFLLNFIGQHTWAATWSRDPDAAHVARMTLEHSYRIGKCSLLHVYATAEQIGPGHVRLRVDGACGPLLVSQSVTPLAPLRARVVHRCHSPRARAPLAKLFLQAESWMFERDIRVWNHKRYVSSPAYVKTDKSLKAFRTWYSQFYSEHSVSFQDAVKRLQDPLDW